MTYSIDNIEHGVHRRGFRDQYRTVLAIAQEFVLFFEPLLLPKHMSEFGLRSQYRKQACIVPRLLNEIACAASHCFDCHADAAPCSHYHDRKRTVESLYLGQ